MLFPIMPAVSLSVSSILASFFQIVANELPGMMTLLPHLYSTTSVVPRFVSASPDSVNSFVIVYFIPAGSR